MSDDWEAIDNPPLEPCNVLLNCPPFQWFYPDGSPAEADPMRDELECMELGFWDGDMWCQRGTGHDIFDGTLPEHLLPTHWMRLPDAPLPAAQGDGE